jgi:hypothetical protein
MQTDNIPSSLETPPTSRISPPVGTNKQELPFSELSWPDFERLCLRLARRTSDIEFCRPYGVPGDNQGGIDLFARLPNGKYRTYQCKRENTFGPAKIKAAVNKFISGEWLRDTEEFYLCTKASLRPVQRSRSLQAEAAKLKKHGVRLFPWDSEELTLMLKAEPEIVDDFFGRAWVASFCGTEVAARLGRRLDQDQLSQLRVGLAKFYFTRFRIHDPTFAFRDPLQTEIGIPILPDILDEESARTPEVASGEGRNPDAGQCDEIDPQTGNMSEWSFNPAGQKSKLGTMPHFGSRRRKRLLFSVDQDRERARFCAF